MGPAASPCDLVNSIVERPKRDTRPPRTQRLAQLLTRQRILGKVFVIPFLFVCFFGVRLFLEKGYSQRAPPAPKGCPSENELRAERHFRSWDEKLEQALRSSDQGPPKTEREAWHAVTDHIHVFTAFVANTTEHAIHIMSLVRDQDPKAKNTPVEHPLLVCIIRMANGTITHSARIRRVWTWRNPSFRNALILCSPPEKTTTEDQDIQVAVAVQGAGEYSLQWLQLHHPPERVEEKCCAVCVRPIYGSGVSLWKVVEFVTHYKIHGVKWFYFYDLDMSSGLKLLLTRLQSAGVEVTLVPFKLIANTDDVHMNGQMPALYDCIFRSMSRTEYYIHVDIDELIVPARHNNIPALVLEEERKLKHVGSLRVPNRYMCAEYPLNVRYSEHKHLPLQTRLYSFHSEDTLHSGMTKHIGRCRAICEAAVHTVAQHCRGYREVELSSSVAFMNHYRGCCGYPAESPVHKVIRLWNFRYISIHPSYSQLSARIERDEVVRSLRKLLH